MVKAGDTVGFRVGKTPVWGTVLGVYDGVGVVELLPDFVDLAENGALIRTDPNDLTPTKVCGCATLGYRPQYGEDRGKLFTTGCDFSRRPGRGSTFLPGHDAKAKGFLIKAAFETDTMENGLGALETAQTFGHKIAMAVAKGIDRTSHRLSERAAKENH